MTTQQFIEFSKPFIQAAKIIFETMIFTKIEAGKPQIKKDVLTRGDVSSIIGITGKHNTDNKSDSVRGMMVLSWPAATYVKIANAMLMESFTEYNEAIADVGAEISNMVLGNAKRDLNPLGYFLDMAIPSTIVGKNHSISYPSDATVVIIPIVCAHGEFYMELCYKM
ncbi:MAG: chemotaxis protein CheX [Oligoflexia bacterium]|nr:chemotaxis protein CheX [Oligoflexia bacterium]